MNDGNELMCPYCKKVVNFQPEEDSIDCPYCGKQIAKKLAEEQKKMAEEELKEKQNPAWLTASVKKKDGKHCPCCGVETAGFACCSKCGLDLWMLEGKTEAEQNELIRQHKKAAKDLAKKAADFNKTVSKLTELNKTMNIPPGVLASTIGKHNFSTCFWGIGMGLGIVNGLVCWGVQCVMMKNANSLSDMHYAWIFPMALSGLILIWQLYLGAKLAGTKGLVRVFLGWLLVELGWLLVGIAGVVEEDISEGRSSRSSYYDRSYY
jgi:DNA-directed RNA polymerase subunit RPC12/RpoP